jgi:hypothetical protein
MPATEKRASRVKKYLKLGLGWLLLGGGFVGLFVPLIQGLLLMGVGAAVVSGESKRMKSFMERMKNKAYNWVRRHSN